MTPPDALTSPEPLVWSTGRGTEVWALFSACVEGNLPAVRALLERDPALVRCHFSYRTPLYFAVRENQLAVAAHLLEMGADPLSLAVNGTLLQTARERGYSEMEHLLETTLQHRFGAGPGGEPVAAAIRDRDRARVRELLDAAHGLLHAGDARGNQPIHWAVMTRNPELIDELLDRGADINARRFDGARPIHLTHGDYHYRGWRDVPGSVEATPEAMYQHLLRRGAYVDLGMAAATGDLARVRELLDADPSLVNQVCDYGSYYVGCGAPLKNAAANGRLEIVRLMLERGANPNLPEEGIAPRGHALYAAVAGGHLEIVRLLLAHGAHPNPPVESSADALSRAISRDDRPMIELLCAHGAARPVDLLAHDNDLRTAAAVFEANPSLADDPEALASAASGAFVLLMLRHRPDLPRRVTVAKDPETTELLFRHGMDPNRRDWLGTPPLHGFAREGEIPHAARFLRHGADIDARDEELRSTALGCAARSGRILMVEFLLRYGARPRLPDDPPWATPLAWARARGHETIAAVLRHHARWGFLPARLGIGCYEALANDLQEALGPGTAGARERLASHFGRQSVPTREQVREWAGRQGVPGVSPDAPDPAAAKEWVARMHGFGSWSDLAVHTADLEQQNARVAPWLEAEAALIRGDEIALDHWLATHAGWIESHPIPPYVPQGPGPAVPTRDARAMIAREHHFESWEAFDAHRAARLDPESDIARFEAAVEAILDGDLPALAGLVTSNRGLVRQRSARTHRATLLHYVAANGVEGFRQRTPANAVGITKALLHAGAEVDALADMYGGATPLGLVATSIHPWLAGVQNALLATLLDHGASLDHPGAGGNHQSAVNACLANGRPDAAVFLASRGAALDLEGASGVGSLQVVRQCFDPAGRLRPPSTASQLQSGFHWACQYGRTTVVAFLLEQGVDPSVPHRGETGLHWASYGGHPGIVRLLLEHRAPVEAEDGTWKNTPLGWAVHGWLNPPAGAHLGHYPDVIARLVAAGSVVNPAWLGDPRIRDHPHIRNALAGAA